MQSITHEEQQERWDKEHRHPTVLPQMDSRDVSYGVEKFVNWLKVRDELTNLSGIEMCCGKGRNVIGLAKKGIQMTGADFSAAAIAEAQKRAKKDGVAHKVTFIVHDVTLPFPITSGSLDFAIDCFGSTDIESADKRHQAFENLKQLIRPGGYLLVYLLSTDDEFHKKMITEHPGPDPGSFIHPVNGKYEKAFTEDEVKRLHSDFRLVALERIPRTPMFFGKQYKCNHIWAVFQKAD